MSFLTGNMKNISLVLGLCFGFACSSSALASGQHLVLADGGELTVEEIQVDGQSALSWRMNPSAGRRTSGALAGFHCIQEGGRSYDLAQDPITGEIHLVAETLVDGRSTITLRSFTGRDWSAPLPVTLDDPTAWDREPRLVYTSTGQAVLAWWREVGEYAGLLVQHGIFGGTGFSVVDFAVQLENPRLLAADVPGGMLRQRGTLVHLSVTPQGDQAYLVLADPRSGEGAVLRLDLDSLADILGGGWSPVPAGVDVPDPEDHAGGNSVGVPEERTTEELALAELIPALAYLVKGGEAWIWGGNARRTGVAVGDLGGTRTRTAMAFANIADPAQTLKFVLEGELAAVQGAVESVEPVVRRERPSRSVRRSR